MTLFGKEVRKALIDKGMTQKQLALELGVSDAYVSAVLRGGKKPTAELLKRLKRIGISGHSMEVGYAMAIGALDVSGLPYSAVSDLVFALGRVQRGGRN